MSNPSSVLVVAAALMIGSVGVAQANVIVNGGFETGDFTGWSVTPVGTGVYSYGVGVAGQVIPSTDFGTFTVDPLDGSYAAYASIAAQQSTTSSVCPNKQSASCLELSQSFSAPSGEYKAGFSVAADGPGQYGNFDQIIIDGGAPALFGRDNIDATYQQDATTFSLGAGTHTIEFVLSGSGLEAAGFSYDDFFVDPTSVSAVPEPSSLPLLLAGLAAIGGALYLGRKRATTRI